jgi:hypothetical protein
MNKKDLFLIFASLFMIFSTMYFASASTQLGWGEGNYTGVSFDTNASGNTQPISITQNGTFFWVTDLATDYFYKYWMNGTYVESYPQGTIDYGGGGTAGFGVGITQNGTYIWIGDYDHREVLKYWMNGTYTGEHFDTSNEGVNLASITQNGTYIWTVDFVNTEVYKYWMNGTYTGEHFNVSESGNTEPYGIVQDGTYFWITSGNNAEVYKYWMNGTYTGFSFDTADEGNTQPYGVTQDGTYFWVTSMNNKEVYKYHLTNSEGAGITLLDGSITNATENANLTFTVNTSEDSYFEWFVDGIRQTFGLNLNTFNYLFNLKTGIYKLVEYQISIIGDAGFQESANIQNQSGTDFPRNLVFNYTGAYNTSSQSGIIYREGTVSHYNLDGSWNYTLITGFSISDIVDGKFWTNGDSSPNSAVAIEYDISNGSEIAGINGGAIGNLYMTDMYFNGTFVWVSDQQDGKAYKYYENGTYTGFYISTQTPVNRGTLGGVSGYQDEIYLFTKEGKILTYLSDGTYVRNISVIPYNVPTQYITADDTYFWTARNGNDIMRKYLKNGTSVANITLNSTHFPFGVCGLAIADSDELLIGNCLFTTKIYKNTLYSNSSCVNDVNCSNFYDGNYDTSDCVNLGTNLTHYINYTIPENVSIATWKVSASGALANFKDNYYFINSTYLQDDSLMLKVFLERIPTSGANTRTSFIPSAFNGTDWIVMDTKTDTQAYLGCGYGEMAEESMYWGVSSLQRFNITTNSIAPQLSFSSPTEVNNSNKSQSWVYVNTSFIETNPKNITFNLYNSASLINSTTYVSTITSINFTNLVDGTYYYNVSAYDIVENYNNTETRKITLDTQSPQISLVSPTEVNNSNKSRNWVFVNASLVEANLKNITFNLYNSSSLVNSTTFTSAITSINFTSLVDESYYYNSSACDIFSNCNSTETRKINLDNTNPYLTIYSSSYNGSVFNKDNIFINLTAYDLNFKNITYSLFEKAGSLFVEKNTTSYLTNTSQINFTNLTYNEYYVDIVVYDIFNNFNTSNISVVLQNSSIITPLSQIYEEVIDNKFLLVQTTLNQAFLDKCWYNITSDNGGTQVNTTFVSNCSSFVVSVVNSKNLNGVYTYTLYVYSNSTTGNIGFSAVTFSTKRIDTTTSGVGPSTSGSSSSGGTTITTPIISKAGNWSISTDVLTGNYQLSMQPAETRDKAILFENLGDVPVNLVLTCESQIENFCQYVKYDNASFVLDSAKGQKVQRFVTISLPDDLPYAEYSFNIVATDKAGNFVDLGVVVDVSSFSLTKITSRFLTLKYNLIFWITLFLTIPITKFSIYRKAKGGAGWATLTGFLLGLIGVIFF